MSTRIAEATALSPYSFSKRYRSSYETPSPSSSPTLPVRKRDQRMRVRIRMMRERESHDLDDESNGLDDEGHGLDDKGHGLDDKGHGLEDEGPGMEEEEEAAPEGQQQAVLVVDTAASEPLGLGYGAARRHPEDGRVYTDIPTYAPPTAPVQTPPSPEWSSELYGSILHDHTQRLNALPPTLFVDIDKDVRELYTRSGVVRDEIFSQRYRFRSLEREHERTAMTFGALWRPVLALEAWAGHVDTQMSDMSWAGYDDHRLVHDLLVQHSTLQRELQEMQGHITALEQERGRREQ
ncbi:hypothetical protein Tco_1008340 [Tanacetum coccineum]